jgi:putative sigma-54 modulation protein
LRLVVTGRHLTVSDTARQDIERRLRPLERLLDDSAVSAQCVVSRERQMYLCEVTVHARGDHMLHGVGRGSRLPIAATAAIAKVEQQAHKLKDRWKKRRRAGSTATETARSVKVEQPVGSDGAGPRVIRARPAEFKPMTLEDATLHLADGGRAFVVFRQASSDTVAILYRRPDGHFGLIEP